MEDTQPPQDSIGLGPGRTGVKGVIRDRAEAVERERQQRAEKIRDHNARMERTALTAREYVEDEEPRGRQRVEERLGPFGHLREVGRSGYVQAVEGEGRGTWVVVHIYDPVRFSPC